VISLVCSLPWFNLASREQQYIDYTRKRLKGRSSIKNKIVDSWRANNDSNDDDDDDDDERLLFEDGGNDATRLTSNNVVLDVHTSPLDAPKQPLLSSDAEQRDLAVEMADE
jgi:hypothetical protein